MLTVCFATILDGGDLDRLFVAGIEEHAIVATAKSEAGERRLESLYVTGMGGQVAIDAVKNFQSRFAINRAQVGAGLGRPDDRDGLRRSLSLICRGRTRA